MIQVQILSSCVNFVKFRRFILKFKEIRYHQLRQCIYIPIQKQFIELQQRQIREQVNIQHIRSMFVINFDFSNHILPLKLLAINIPVLITEVLTYPFQRLQTLLIAQPNYITKNQFKEAQLILKSMISIEGFPKLLHGMRYSVDYMATQMTTKFLLFDFLIEKTLTSIKSDEKWKLVSICLFSNFVSTAMAQIAFNYLTIASSLPISKSNRPQDVKIKLQNYTRRKKIPIDGLKYTLPISIVNTGIELLILSQTVDWVSRQSKMSYVLADLLTALSIFTLTSFFSHYAFQRQIQICKGLPERSIPYAKGLFGSLIRYNLKGLSLYSLYLLYFEMKTKRQIEAMYPRRTFDSTPQSYRQ